MALTYISILLLTSLLSTPALRNTPIGPVALALLAHFAFFKTGHHAVLSFIMWDAAFIPLGKTLRYPWAPIFVILNTFGPQILCAASVPLLTLWCEPYPFPAKDSATNHELGRTLLRPSTAPSAVAGSVSSPASGQASSPAPATPLEEAQAQTPEQTRAAHRATLLARIRRDMLTHFAAYAAINVATTAWAAHLRRHLMLYRVFMPRWMLGGVSMVVAELAGVAIGMGGVRWSVAAVCGVLGW
ncbi:hypothetical protein MRB53_037138 [Persea americana]|nr:hypothetical protein MRB53_037138 [Persea americana]